MFSGSIRTIAGMVFCSLALSGYIFFRTGTFETDYLSFLTKRYAKINTLYAGFVSSHELTNENLTAFLNKVTEDNDDLAFIALKDRDGRVSLTSANSSILSDSPVYEEICTEAFAGKIYTGSEMHTASKYIGGKKFYFLSKSASGGSVVAVYPRRLPGSIIALMAAEAFAVLAGAMVFFALIILLLRKLRTSALPRSGDPRRNASGKTKSGIDQIKNELYRLLIEFDAVTVSLSILSSGKSPSRQIGWSQGKFFNSRISDIPSVETNAEMLREIEKGSHLIRDKGKRIVAPIISGKKLIAVIAVDLPKKGSGAQIHALKKKSSALASAL